ncbi:MAG: vitamin B12 transporter [Saprospiraceae bacterium]|jgi:vitamin B12 transporter
MRIISITIIFLFIVSANSIAQTDTSAYLLDQVIVKDNRIQIPFSEHSRTINIISREQIELSPAQSIPELLQNVAGIDIRQRGAHGVQADVSIRGGTFDQTLILINGIKMSDPQTGHHALNIPVDLESIERIEILKGPGARIYGQNAFSGAINIVTKIPTERYAKLAVTAGENGLGGLSASFALPKSNFNQYFSFSRYFADGYRYNTDYDITNYFYQSSFKYLNQELEVLASFSEREFGANRFYGNDADFFADQYEEVQTSLVSLGYRNIKGDFAFHPRVSWRRNQDEYILVRNNPAFYRNLHISDVLSLELNADYYSDLGATGVGLDLSTIKLRSNNLGNRSRNVATFFLEHRFKFREDKIDITPGLSASYYSDFGGKFFPGIDVGYQINKNFKWYGNIGYTWRIPTFTDLFYEDAANLGNENLSPESAISYEAGLKYIGNGINLQISYFLRDGTELIDWTKADSLAKWQPQNFSNIQMSGIDFSANLNLKKLLDQDIIQNLRIGYTYINAEEPEADVAFSRYVLENLKQQLVIGLDHRLFGKLYHSISYRYLDRVSLADYNLMDLKLSWKTKRVTIFGQVDNLLDTEYRESNLVDMPGRWISGGVKFKFGL